MIFYFEVDPKESFLDIQTYLREEFWIYVNKHNYKQVIYYEGKENKKHMVLSEMDWEDLKKKYPTQTRSNFTLTMSFIDQHFTSIDEAIKNAAPYHEGISCGFCAIQPIIGTLYTCFECPNFHLCEVCEADQQHSHHQMFSTKKPQIKAKLHGGTHCDSCEVKPIIGIRYKCVSCHNRNFCESCTKFILLPCNDHEMIRFPYRGEEAAAGTVVSETNVQPVEDNQLKIINDKLDKLMKRMTLMETKIFNIDGDSAGKADEVESRKQEEKTDES